MELKCQRHRLCVVRDEAGREGCCVATVGHLVLSNALLLRVFLHLLRRQG